MYYKEKLIDGILHWRGTPDGEWQPVPIEKLSQRVVVAEKFHSDVNANYRAAVAAALAELRKELADTIENPPPDEGSRLYDAATRTAVCGLDAVIIKLGLEKQ